MRTRACGGESAEDHSLRVCGMFGERGFVAELMCRVKCLDRSLGKRGKGLESPSQRLSFILQAGGYLGKHRFGAVKLVAPLCISIAS